MAVSLYNLILSLYLHVLRILIGGVAVVALTITPVTVQADICCCNIQWLCNHESSRDTFNIYHCKKATPPVGITLQVLQPNVFLEHTT